MPLGRPTDYTPELADRICAELSEGRSLRRICMAEDMPCAMSVYRWMRTYPDFCDNYARAREDQADSLADEIQEIADDSGEDYVDTDTGQVFNGENVQRSRLRVDARKWIASKLKPKKYGDRVSQEISGPSGGPIRVIAATVEDEAL